MKLQILLLVGFTLLASQASGNVNVYQKNNSWYKAGRKTIEENLSDRNNTNRAKNVILIISDGNGVGANYAARLWRGQKEGGYGDEYVMSYEKFPHMALAKTYNTNAMTPDSAGTLVAIVSGVKTKFGVLGMDDSYPRGECLTKDKQKLTLFSKIVKSMNKKVAIVSTARITHATPAALYAYSGDRNWESNEKIPEGCAQKDIALQLIDNLSSGTVDIALGGGRRHFIPKDFVDSEGKNGKRTDGVNLIEKAKSLGVSYAHDPESLKKIGNTNRPILGLFESSHMEYEVDRDSDPSILEMTTAALNNIQNNPEGYFLFIEAGRVDHGLHEGNMYKAVVEQNVLEKTVAYLVENVDLSETLIIVTADHEHAVAFNGYCGRGSQILGFCMEINPEGTMHTGKEIVALDGKPYEVISFANGSGTILHENHEEDLYKTITDEKVAEHLRKKLAWSGRRKTDEFKHDFHKDPTHQQEALIPMKSETHSGEDVAVYAAGPWAHLLNGTIEQNVIFHVMNYAINQ